MTLSCIVASGQRLAALKAFGDVGDEVLGEVAGKALKGGGVLLDKGDEVLGGLVLLTEDVVVVGVERASVAIVEANAGGDGDDVGGGLIGGGVVGERVNGKANDIAVEDGIGGGGIVGGFGAEGGAGGELLENGLGHGEFDVVGLCVVFEGRDVDEAGRRGQVGGVAGGVVAAAGE